MQPKPEDKAEVQVSHPSCYEYPGRRQGTGMTGRWQQCYGITFPLSMFLAQDSSIQKSTRFKHSKYFSTRAS